MVVNIKKTTFSRGFVIAFDLVICNFVIYRWSVQSPVINFVDKGRAKVKNTLSKVGFVQN